VKAILKKNGKTIKSIFPVTNGHSPFLGNIPHRQLNQFESSIFGRENLLIVLLLQLSLHTLHDGSFRYWKHPRVKLLRIRYFNNLSQGSLPENQKCWIRKWAD